MLPVLENLRIQITIRPFLSAPLTAWDSLKDFLIVSKDDDGYFSPTKDAQLEGLLEQSRLALGEGDQSISMVCDRRDFDFASSHA